MKKCETKGIGLLNKMERIAIFQINESEGATNEFPQIFLLFKVSYKENYFSVRFSTIHTSSQEQLSLIFEPCNLDLLFMFSFRITTKISM